MGDSRFEFSTKFRFPEYMWHFSNIHKHIDFSIAKNANLPSKSHWDETWDFVSKFQKLKFCQKWLDLRQISSRYHLSTLEITSWSKNPKIFFKPLKALCSLPIIFCIIFPVDFLLICALLYIPSNESTKCTQRPLNNQISKWGHSFTK